MKTVMVFSGLPGAGKDTAADYFVEKYGAVKLQCKDPLWDMAKAMLVRGHGKEAGEVLYKAAIESTAGGFKDTNVVYDGMTFRQLLIWISESMIKPALGAHVFGRSLTDRVRESLLTNDLVVVPDCGFLPELLELENVNAPATTSKPYVELTFVRITSEENQNIEDSRTANLAQLWQYVTGSNWTAGCVHNPNDGVHDTKEYFRQELERISTFYNFPPRKDSTVCE